MKTDILSGSDVKWKQVGLFLTLTIAISWLVDLAMWLRFGYSEYTVLFFQLQMLIPAFSAIVLQRYVFRDSRIYYREYKGRPAWFFDFYLVFTALFFALAAAVLWKPELYQSVGNGLISLASVVSLVVLVLIRFMSGKEAFHRAGLAGGIWTAWVLVWLAVVGFLGAQIGLNTVLGLGTAPDRTMLAESLGMPVPMMLVFTFFNLVVVNPLLGIVVAFGEEYGWRGYLQAELIKLGRLKGVLLVGVVWGIWHAPAVAMGHNYPQYPLWGPVVFLVFNLLLAVFLGYVKLKTGGIWLAAFMHAVLNAAWQWLVLAVNTPRDPMFSFGIGLYGIGAALVLALIVLRDPVWKSGMRSSTDLLSESVANEEVL